MSSPVKILIVGNGFGGIYALKKLHKYFCGDSRVRIALIGEKNYFLFTPLLHEVATGGINPENIVEPIRKIFRCCLDKFHLGKAENISLADKTVEVEGKKILYDYLILAPGAQTNFYGIPGAEQYSFSLKSLEDAIKIKNHCILQMEHASHVKDRAERKKMLTFVVVGGGATGVELVAELEEFLKETLGYYYAPEIMEDMSIVLVQKEGELLTKFSLKLRKKSLAVLKRKGIDVLLNTSVNEVRDEEILLNNNTGIATQTVIWVAGIKSADLNFDKVVLKVEGGQFIVNEYLQLKGHKEIFAVGDVAYLKPKGEYAPLPALAQVASKEASIAAKNIKLLIEGKELKSFVYHTFGNLVSLGQWMAVGELFGFSFSGRFTWWIWRTVYLFKLISWKKKLKVATDWTINLFLPRDISQF